MYTSLEQTTEIEISVYCILQQNKKYVYTVLQQNKKYVYTVLEQNMK